MILDSKGRPLRRSAGFLSSFQPERKPTTESLCDAIGFQIYPVYEDEEESSTQRFCTKANGCGADNNRQAKETKPLL
jgi:hypothetical protein